MLQILVLVGTSRLGYPLLLCLDKSLVVIVKLRPNNRAAGPLWSGALLSRQTARTRSPLGEGQVAPRVPEEVALSQNSWGPRTRAGSRIPIYYPISDTPPGLIRSRHVAKPRGFH